MTYTESLRAIVALALLEDAGTGDITTLATIAAQNECSAHIIAKDHGVFAGLNAARETLRQVDSTARITFKIKDGAVVDPGDIICTMRGKTQSILVAERVMLNFMQRLSGVASTTHVYADALAETGVQIIDTRKTTPGMRLLEKEAVRAGGGANHRIGLWDMFLVKDNHEHAAGGITGAFERVLAFKKEQSNSAPIELETRTMAEVREAASLQPDRIMLDNMSCVQMKKAVKIIRGMSAPIEIEASGNITLRRLCAVAACGVDFISVGALTHSVPALDLSLLFI